MNYLATKYWEIEPLTFWDNLIFDIQCPNEPRGWALRGHYRNGKPKSWFQMTILAQGCETQDELIEKAIEFTKIEIGKEMLKKLERE